MNDSIKRISLDIHKVSSSETVNAKRGDTGRTIHISLVDGGVPYIISEDCYAVFTAKKPDGKVVYNKCTIENNTIIYEVTEQTVAMEGKVNCEIKLYGADDKLITSSKFTILVYGTVYNEGDEVESSDEFNALTSLMADTRKAVKEAQEAIKVAQEMEASLLITDASGSPVAIDDAAEHSLLSLKLYGKTTQDGTPTPEAPVDLVSVGDGGTVNVNVAGKNLCDVSVIKLGEPTIMSRTETGFVFTRGEFVGGTYASFTMPILKGQTVTFSCKGSAYQPTLIIYKDAVYGTQLKNVADKGILTYTSAETIPAAVFAVVISSKNADCEVSDIQIELGLNATAYEPYKGQKHTVSTPNGLRGIPVTSGGNYTDGYGQRWICDEIDFDRGVYVQRINTLTPKSVIRSYDNYAGTNRVAIVCTNALYSAGNVIGAVICDSLQPLSANDQYVLNNSGIANVYGDIAITIKDIASEAAVKQWLNDNTIKIQYVLATPIETPLSEEELAAYTALHTYRDETTVSNDAGAYMELEYVMDAKKYIDSLVGGNSHTTGTILPATVE